MNLEKFWLRGFKQRNGCKNSYTILNNIHAKLFEYFLFCDELPKEILIQYQSPVKRKRNPNVNNFPIIRHHNLKVVYLFAFYSKNANSLITYLGVSLKGHHLEAVKWVHL